MPGVDWGLVVLGEAIDPCEGEFVADVDLSLSFAVNGICSCVGHNVIVIQRSIDQIFQIMYNTKLFTLHTVFVSIAAKNTISLSYTSIISHL